MSMNPYPSNDPLGEVLFHTPNIGINAGHNIPPIPGNENVFIQTYIAVTLLGCSFVVCSTIFICIFA
jgi:hypothetical protein